MRSRRFRRDTIEDRFDGGSVPRIAIECGFETTAQTIELTHRTRLLWI
jgi:hypothetical protein